MYCPNCSEPKANDATQFCKRCGLDLFGLSEFVESGGSEALGPNAKNKTRTGIRQGVVLFAIGLMLIPIWMFIAVVFPPNDRLVESAPSTTPAETIAWIGMWMAFIAGALRIGYAFVFEEKRSATIHAQTSGHENSSARHPHEALPSADAFRPAQPESWKTTGDLFDRVRRTSKTSGELSEVNPLNEK